MTHDFLLAVVSVLIASSGCGAELRPTATGTQRGIVSCLAFSPDGAVLACGSRSLTGGAPRDRWAGQVTIRSAHDLSERAVQDIDRWVNRVSFSPDAKILALACGEYHKAVPPEENRYLQYVENPGEVRLLEASSLRVQRSLAHPEGVFDLAYSPAGPVVAALVGGAPEGGGLVRLWSMPAYQLISDLHDHTGWAETPANFLGCSLAWSSDGELLAVAEAVRGANEAGIVKLWDVASGKLRTKLSVERGLAVAVDISPDGTTIAVATQLQVALYSIASGDLKVRLEQRPGRDVVAFSPDGTLLAVAGAWKLSRGTGYGEIALWDTTSGKRLTETQLSSAGTWIRSIAFSPDGKRLAAGDVSGVIQIWRMPEYPRAKRR